MKEIEGYECRYSVTREGKVYSHIRSRYLVPYYNSKGYFIIGLRKEGKRKTITIHRLVALAFIENIYNKPQVNHKNGIKDDNRFENLEWVTNAENVQHAFDNGLSVGMKGDKNHRSKLKENEVVKIKQMIKEGIELKLIASKYGVSRRMINNIKLNKNWNHV